MDEACKQHDIAYIIHKDLESRHRADRALADAAWERVKAKDASIGEKSVAWLVTNAMRAKTKLGAGNLTLNKLVRHARTAVRGLRKSKNVKQAALTALKAARAFKKGRIVTKTDRVLALPKSGGILPLLPIFAGLSAIGSLAGGAAGIAKAINETKDAKKKFAEMQRHNQTLEAIALGKGLYLKPYKKGLGLYMTPYVKQSKNF